MIDPNYVIDLQYESIGMSPVTCIAIDGEIHFVNTVTAATTLFIMAINAKVSKKKFHFLVTNPVF